jgi:hypothetical protein
MMRAMKIEPLVCLNWSRVLRCFAALAALSAIVGCGGADASGDLSVVVKDVSMAVVADATVTTDPATKTLTTDSAGRARFTALPARAYTVKAESAGLGEATATVTLVAGDSREITLTLRTVGPGGTDGGTDASAADADGGDDGQAPPVDASTTEVGALDAGTAIVLADLTKDTNGVNLSWTTNDTFPSYRIYRGQDPSGGGFSIIDIVNDATARKYRDETVTLGTAYRYRVAGVTADHTEVTSNVQAITAGVFIAINTQVERMKADPQRPYLYALDKVNNSLHFVNLTTNEEEKSIFVGSAPTALDINAANTELYVANSGSTEITVVDLATRTKARSLLVTPAANSYPNGNPSKIAATAGNTLVFAGPDSSSGIQLASAATGAMITSAYSSSIYSVVASPDGTHVYTGGYSLVRFDIVGTTMKQVDTSNDWSGYSTTVLSRSGDGTYLFWGAKKVLATNLKSVLGTFPETILLANADGSLAVGAVRVYDGNTFTAKATLPLSTPVLTLSADGKTLFLYHQLTSRIYLWKMP